MPSPISFLVLATITAMLYYLLTSFPQLLSAIYNIFLFLKFFIMVLFNISYLTSFNRNAAPAWFYLLAMFVGPMLVHLVVSHEYVTKYVALPMNLAGFWLGMDGKTDLYGEKKRFVRNLVIYSILALIIFD